MASSNKKQLIKVQVARFDNLESYELAQVRIRNSIYYPFFRFIIIKRVKMIKTVDLLYKSPLFLSFLIELKNIAMR